jgi:hypothetical protein
VAGAMSEPPPPQGGWPESHHVEIFWFFQILQKIGERIGRGKDSFCGGMWSTHKHLFQCSEAALVDGKCGCYYGGCVTGP